MQPTLRSTAAFTAIGLAALAAPAARAQTQDLFVSNASGTISRFAGTGPGTFSSTFTALPGATVGPTYGLGFDARGDLFVAKVDGVSRGRGSIVEYAAGATPGTFGTPTALTDPSLNLPVGLAVDARGDVFAANSNGNSITEFLAGATPGTFGGTTTVPGNGTGGLAFDTQGNLFVGGSTVVEFPVNPVTGMVGAGSQVIGPNSGGAFSTLALDARGDLFTEEANGPNTPMGGALVEFAAGATPGTFGPATTLADPNRTLNGTGGLAVDARGDLFAVTGPSGGNFRAPGNIVEFASTGMGTFAAAQIVENGSGLVDQSGLINPQFLAFGPSAPPAVPEASTTVSLGLLLALGTGGVVMARKKSKTDA